jgi:hypothetical protein
MAERNPQKRESLSSVVTAPLRWLYQLKPIEKFTVVLCVVGVLQFWSFVKSERAFVFPSTVEFVGLASADISQPIILNVELSNYGRSQARIGKLVAFVTTDPLAPEPNYETPGRVERAYPPVPSNGKIAEELNFSNWAKPTAEQVRDGSLPFHVFGRVVYEDDYSKLLGISFFGDRDSDFCFVYVANKDDPNKSLFRDCPEPKYTSAH